jgi:hypothetical protein
MSRDEIVDQLLGSLGLGTVTLPQALGKAWDAGRAEERVDTLRMEKACREAKRLRKMPAPSDTEGR